MKQLLSVLTSPRHSTATVLTCTLLLGGLVVFNLYYFFAQLTAATPDAPAQAIATLPNGQSLLETATVATSQNPTFSPEGVLAAVSGMLLFAIFVSLLFIAVRRQRQSRDSRSIELLEQLGKALQDYRQDYGHYPLPHTDDSKPWVEGVLLTEWEEAGLPPTEVMQRYEVDWPDSRQNSTTEIDGQQYLYLPLQKGQDFILFTQLEEDFLQEGDAIPLPEHRKMFNFWISNRPELTMPAEVQEEISQDLSSWLPRKKIDWQDRSRVFHAMAEKEALKQNPDQLATQPEVPRLFDDELQ